MIISRQLSSTQLGTTRLKSCFPLKTSCKPEEFEIPMEIWKYGKNGKMEKMKKMEKTEKTEKT